MAGGFEPVLLCFEKPPFGDDNWCHRRMVAEWLSDTLGIEVPEYERRSIPGFMLPGFE
ncbi:MAG: DUF488 domain-containing protein [Candidatus Glassbacteria bacterium]|nr:DUF488 domain-containing protein [Candidatus Glassbacteria bacterium]